MAARARAAGAGERIPPARLQELQLELEAARTTLLGLEEESRTMRAQRDTLGPRVDAARLELEARREKRSEAK